LTVLNERQEARCSSANQTRNFRQNAIHEADDEYTSQVYHDSPITNTTSIEEDSTGNDMGLDEFESETVSTHAYQTER
jgi:hypothetical protein